MSSDRTAARVPNSVLRAALIGVGLAATWFAASAILDAPHANAAEMAPTSASMGLVGGLTDGLLDTVDSTLGTVADTVDSGLVSAVIAPVSETVDTVVVEVVAPLPVVGEPVTQLTGTAPATAVLTPIGSTLDSVLGAAGQAVDSAGGVIGGLQDQPLPLGPSVGTAPTTTPLLAILIPTDAGALQIASNSTETTTEAAGSAAGTADLGARSVVFAPAEPGTPRSPLDPSDNGTAVPTNSSAGNGAAAAATLGDRFTLVPASGLGTPADDTQTPISATYDTDTSPD